MPLRHQCGWRAGISAACCDTAPASGPGRYMPCCPVACGLQDALVLATSTIAYTLKFCRRLLVVSPWHSFQTAAGHFTQQMSATTVIHDEVSFACMRVYRMLLQRTPACMPHRVFDSRRGEVDGVFGSTNGSAVWHPSVMVIERQVLSSSLNELNLVRLLGAVSRQLRVSACCGCGL